MLPKHFIISLLLATVAVVTAADVFVQMDEFWHTMDQQFEKVNDEMNKMFENSLWNDPPCHESEQGNVYQVILRLNGISENEIKVNTNRNIVVVYAVHDEPNMRRQYHHTQVIPAGYETIGRWKFNAHKYILILKFDRVLTNGNSATGSYDNTRFLANPYQPQNEYQNTNLPGQFYSTNNGHVLPAGYQGTEGNIHQTGQVQTGPGGSKINYNIQVPIAQESTYTGSYPQGQIHSTRDQEEQFGSGGATSVYNRPRQQSGGQGYHYEAAYPGGGQGSTNGEGHSSAGKGSNYGAGYPAGGPVSNNDAQYSSAGRALNYDTRQPSNNNVNGVTDIYSSSSHQRRSGEGFVQGDPNTYRQWQTATSNSQNQYHVDSNGQMIPVGQDVTLPDGFRVNESNKQFRSVSKTHTVHRAPEWSGAGNAGGSW